VAQLFSLGVIRAMALSPKMQKFISRLPGSGSDDCILGDEFERIMVSEDDDFRDEYLRAMPSYGYRYHFVEELQKSRRHKQLASSQEKSNPNRHDDSWYKKIVVGIVISIVAGLVLLLIKYYFGL
jgi:hypothetical protein